MKSSNTNRIALWTMLVITGLWLLAYPIARSTPAELLPDVVGKIYDGLNVLFTALAFGGVIATLAFQSEEARNNRREAIEQSILDLFQIFTGPDFQHVKDRAFLALLAAIKCRPYAEYLVSRLFVVDQIKTLPPDSFDVLRSLDAAKTGLDAQALTGADRADRLKLDDMLNFFAMLAHRESTSTVIRHCDFAYDWWRPALWLIAQLQLERWRNSPAIREYCKSRLLCETLKTLDAVYQHPPFSSDREVWAYLARHPKMQDFGIDPAFSPR